MWCVHTQLSGTSLTLGTCSSWLEYYVQCSLCLISLTYCIVETFEVENLSKFRGFIGCFLCEIWGHGIFWRHQRSFCTKVFHCMVAALAPQTAALPVGVVCWRQSLVVELFLAQLYTLYTGYINSLVKEITVMSNVFFVPFLSYNKEHGMVG